jgi:hypothetical protein
VLDTAISGGYNPPTSKGQPTAFPTAEMSADQEDAQVAQLVEHATENRSVGGSTPSLGTISLKRISSVATDQN